MLLMGDHPPVPRGDPASLGHIRWLGGSPCSGKSTIADRLAARVGFTVYHVDDAFGDFVRRITPARHPLTHKWTHTPWQQLWMQSPEVLLAEAIAAYTEQFELILEDLRALPHTGLVLAEGTSLLPGLVAPLLSRPNQALWMMPTASFQREMYPKRGDWVQEILATCDDPNAALVNWMDRDAAFARWVADEAAARGLPGIWVDGALGLEDRTALVAEVLRLDNEVLAEA
jgi:2-phosphoglycerate kinase